ncbi:MAG: ABC transporter ATP-binding protein [Propioniciclava sp.]|uniref:ABC transporter ATP-binding protein n=1 Tax=Propioniciclava sp. TaxID=2038686 RepID=UPI0039E53BC3
MLIETRDLTKTLGGNEILKGIGFEAEGRQTIGVIGPNGSGKSTLLKCIYRVLEPSGGAVWIDGRPITDLPPKQTARQLAVVAQHNHVSFDFTVLDIVMLGRAPHKRMLDRDTGEDYAIARESLAAVNLAGFEERSFATLSGSEQQRVILARALTQQTPCLVLDEPTNHMDIRYQLQLMTLVRSLGKTIVCAVHDLNIAATYCDYLYVLHEGRVVASGEPHAVLTVELIQDVYGVRPTLIHDEHGRLHILYGADALVP